MDTPLIKFHPTFYQLLETAVTRFLHETLTLEEKLQVSVKLTKRGAK